MKTFVDLDCALCDALGDHRKQAILISVLLSAESSMRTGVSNVFSRGSESSSWIKNLEFHRPVAMSAYISPVREKISPA